MFLFIGLGNKGTEYLKTRHNIGFITLDVLCKTLEINQNSILKFSSEVFSFEFKNQKIICAKPQTFMNLSGKAVLELMRFYKIPIENIFVFHDDLDLQLAKIKFKIGGGSAGHNGLKSLDEIIGNGYTRIRIGIGRPEFKDDVSNFVLSNFKKDELLEIQAKLEKMFENLQELLNKNFSALG